MIISKFSNFFNLILVPAILQYESYDFNSNTISNATKDSNSITNNKQSLSDLLEFVIFF